MKEKKQASEAYRNEDKQKLEILHKEIASVDERTMTQVLASEPFECFLNRDKKYWESKLCQDDPELYLKEITLINTYLKNEWPSAIINPTKETTKLPIDVDWWIPEMECGLIYQTGYIHGQKPFIHNKECLKELEEWEEEVENCYTEEEVDFIYSCLDTWSKKDVEIRHIIRDEDLKVVEMFDMVDGASPEYIVKSIKDRVLDLHLDFTVNELKTEFNSLKRDINGTCKNTSASNKNIKAFLQNQFYKVEKKLYHDPEVKYKLDRNRQRYQFTLMENLSIGQILGGFKITGIHFGYSFFNPRLFTWFIDHENLQGKCCYDPTGGWGHRMLGGQQLSKYIYNDLSHHTVEGVKTMALFHDITNTVFYENDARTFEPTEEYDAMFTCVPYYADNKDIEKYECDGFKSKEDYDDFICSLYNKYLNKESCKVFGLVIREDMLPENLRKNIVEEYPLKLTKSHFQYYAAKKNIEYLYIFRKENS